jgi:hypothetical protein
MDMITDVKIMPTLLMQNFSEVCNKATLARGINHSGVQVIITKSPQFYKDLP